MSVQPSYPRVPEIAARRRTVKILSSEPTEPGSFGPEVLNGLLETASWAPFHKASAKSWREGGAQDSLVPWRAHVVAGEACRKLRTWLIARDDRSKMVQMLATTRDLVIVTWLPNPAEADHGALFEPTLANMEHIAAASAAIQNLLLAATEQGIPNYWSSGGRLRDPETHAYLGMRPGELLLGAIFLFPEGSDAGDGVVTGKLRDQRGPLSSWSRTVEL